MIHYNKSGNVAILTSLLVLLAGADGYAGGTLSTSESPNKIPVPDDVQQSIQSSIASVYLSDPKEKVNGINVINQAKILCSDLSKFSASSSSEHRQALQGVASDCWQALATGGSFTQSRRLTASVKKIRSFVESLNSKYLNKKGDHLVAPVEMSMTKKATIVIDKTYRHNDLTPVAWLKKKVDSEASPVSFPLSANLAAWIYQAQQAPDGDEDPRINAKICTEMAETHRRGQSGLSDKKFKSYFYDDCVNNLSGNSSSLYTNNLAISMQETPITDAAAKNAIIKAHRSVVANGLSSNMDDHTHNLVIRRSVEDSFYNNLGKRTEFSADGFDAEYAPSRQSDQAVVDEPVVAKPVPVIDNKTGLASVPNRQPVDPMAPPVFGRHHKLSFSSPIVQINNNPSTDETILLHSDSSIVSHDSINSASSVDNPLSMKPYSSERANRLSQPNKVNSPINSRRNSLASTESAAAAAAAVSVNSVTSSPQSQPYRAISSVSRATSVELGGGTEIDQALMAAAKAQIARKAELQFGHGDGRTARKISKSEYKGVMSNLKALVDIQKSKDFEKQKSGLMTENLIKALGGNKAQIDTLCHGLDINSPVCHNLMNQEILKNADGTKKITEANKKYDEISDDKEHEDKKDAAYCGKFAAYKDYYSSRAKKDKDNKVHATALAKSSDEANINCQEWLKSKRLINAIHKKLHKDPAGNLVKKDGIGLTPKESQRVANYEQNVTYRAALLEASTLKMSKVFADPAYKDPEANINSYVETNPAFKAPKKSYYQRFKDCFKKNDKPADGILQNLSNIAYVTNPLQSQLQDQDEDEGLFLHYSDDEYRNNEEDSHTAFSYVPSSQIPANNNNSRIQFQNGRPLDNNVNINRLPIPDSNDGLSDGDFDSALHGDFDSLIHEDFDSVLRLEPISRH